MQAVTAEILDVLSVPRVSAPNAASVASVLPLLFPRGTGGPDRNVPYAARGIVFVTSEEDDDTVKAFQAEVEAELLTALHMGTNHPHPQAQARVLTMCRSLSGLALPLARRWPPAVLGVPHARLPR